MRYLLIFVFLTLFFSAIGLAWRSGAIKDLWAEVRPFVFYALAAAAAALALMHIAYMGGHVSLL